tara:strand:- start:4 stop:363 length:360 start_codon:yes stop_codon:yes gene_type:complete
MSKSIVIDSILNQYSYNEIKNKDDLIFLMRSNEIGYFTVYVGNKSYYYIIWCDTTPTMQPIHPFVHQYLDIIDYNFASNSGIYIIIKYDSKTHKVLNIDKTLSELREEFLLNIRKNHFS